MNVEEGNELLELWQEIEHADGCGGMIDRHFHTLATPGRALAVADGDSWEELWRCLVFHEIQGRGR